MTESYNPESYWDNVASEISSRSDVKVIAGDDEPYYRYKRKRFLELLASIDFTGQTVLEIGSGPGGNLGFIHDRGCKRVSGVDISSQMIELAKSNLKGRDIDIHKVDGAELPFPDSTFDVVFTSTVLQHNTNEENLSQLIGEICRVSGSEVLLFERIEKQLMGHESNMGRPISYYSQLLNNHGFSLAQTQSMPIQASYYTCGAIRKLLNPKGRKEGEPLTKISVILENILLPFTTLLDTVIPSKRDLMLLRFKRQ